MGMDVGDLTAPHISPDSRSQATCMLQKLMDFIHTIFVLKLEAGMGQTDGQTGAIYTKPLGGERAYNKQHMYYCAGINSDRQADYIQEESNTSKITWSKYLQQTLQN